MTRDEINSELTALCDRLAKAKYFDTAMLILIVKAAVTLEVEEQVNAACEAVSRPIFDTSNFANKLEVARTEGHKEGLEEVIQIFKSHFGITDEQIADVWPEHFDE